jgi:hypothetical protein
MKKVRLLQAFHEIEVGQNTVIAIQAGLAVRLGNRLELAFKLLTDHCDIRARRTSEGRHRRLGMGLIRCQRAAGERRRPTTTADRLAE